MKTLYGIRGTFKAGDHAGQILATVGAGRHPTFYELRTKDEAQQYVNVLGDEWEVVKLTPDIYKSNGINPPKTLKKR